jgi:outer membrane protein OmpA-like peptidoglycan-associated protein
MKKGLLLITLCTAGWLSQSYGQIPLAAEKVVVANERRVNSEELEFSPVFFKDGIVFISTRFESVMMNVKDKNIGSKNIMSIYRSQRDTAGFLQEPVPLANELIFRLHEGPVAFDRTGETIYFTRNENLKEAPDGYKKLQIYAASFNGEVWENVRKLPFNNADFNYCHPTISPGLDVMYIASDIPGGYGGMDIYSVEKKDGEWSELTNLGEEVNTSGNEVFPFIAADGTLYFASGGQGGYGNLDMFYSRRRSGVWQKPVNLQLPFNTPADDFGFIVDRDNKNGYFSSDRKGGFGGDDIYGFYIEGEGRPVAGNGRGLEDMVVKDENGNPMEGAIVSAINLDQVSLSAGDDRVVKLLPAGEGNENFILDVNTYDLGDFGKTDASGKTDIPLAPGSYVVKITQKGYVPDYVVVTPETDLSALDVQLRRAVDCVPLSGSVLMGSARTPASGAAVQIVDVETREAVTVYSDEKGVFEYCVRCNRNFTVYATKNEVSSPPGIVSTRGVACGPDSNIDLPLFIYGSPLFAGMTIVLPNIYFNFDDAALRPDAYKDLDEVANMLREFPDMKLELASHTDARGGRDYNQKLSERRSASVWAYLTRQGIGGPRLTPMGYGESQIRNRCKDGVACPEEDHQYNRRTEIKILELGEPEQFTSGGEARAVADVGFDPAAGEPDVGKGGQESISPQLADELNDAGESSIGGAFAVVAGTFSNHDFAVRRAGLLMEMGYQDVHIVRQNSNGLYAVWVKTFDEKPEASSLVSELAAQQLESYVKKR